MDFDTEASWPMLLCPKTVKTLALKGLTEIQGIWLQKKNKKTAIPKIKGFFSEKSQ